MNELQSLINLCDKYSFLFNSIPSILWRYKHNNLIELSDNDNLLLIILKKLDSNIYEFNSPEINCLKINGLNTKFFISFLQQHKRKIINIIKDKLDKKIPLTEIDIHVLKNLNCTDILEIHKQQLKQKYPDILSLDIHFSNVYYHNILHDLETEQILTSEQMNWLKGNNINDILSLVYFVNLKIKYKVKLKTDLSLSSHLYKLIKKIDSNILLTENDLNFLKKRKLKEIIDISVTKYTDYLNFQNRSIYTIK